MGYGKAEQTVNVTVNFRGEDKPGEVGFVTRKRPILVDNTWVDSDEDEMLFGYCLSGNLTHMCYGNLVCGIETWEDFAVTGKHARKFDEFYFDAGSNGSPLYITYTELQRAMHELGLISDDAVKYCEECGHSKLLHSESEENRCECTKILTETKEITGYCSCVAFYMDSEEEKEVPIPDSELPGMWSNSDFLE